MAHNTDGGVFSMSALKSFRAAAAHMSFTKAAKTLAVTQSAVSQRVRLLEEQLGVPLFIRDKRKLALTDEGLFLHRQSDEAFDIIRRALDNIRAGKIQYRAVLGVLASFASQWLVPRLGDFYRSHPRMQLVIRSVNHTIEVENEGVELAVVTLPKPPISPNVVWRLMWRERLLVVCSPDYLRAQKLPLRRPKDLANHVLLHDETEIADERGLDWRALFEYCKIPPPADIYGGQFFTQSDIVLRAAIEGHGVALVRTSLASTDLKKGLLVRPLEIDIPTRAGCYLCGLKSSWDTAKITALRAWLLGEAAADRARLRHKKSGGTKK